MRRHTANVATRIECNWIGKETEKGAAFKRGWLRILSISRTRDSLRRQFSCIVANATRTRLQPGKGAHLPYHFTAFNFFKNFNLPP